MTLFSKYFRKPCLILFASVFLFSCKQNDRIKITENYLEAYVELGFEKLSEYLFETITIIDNGYRKTYSLAEFQTYYEWDSVFNPISIIQEISLNGDDVFVTVSTQSERFEFL